MSDSEILISSITSGEGITSPCVCNCKLDDQDICQGCFRSIKEIIGWRDRSTKEQLAIIANSKQRKLDREDSLQAQ